MKTRNLKVQEGDRVMNQTGIHATVKCFDDGAVYVKFDIEDHIYKYTWNEFDIALGGAMNHYQTIANVACEDPNNDNIVYKARAIISWYIDHNYGADADGNRGITRTFVDEVELQDPEREIYADRPAYIFLINKLRKLLHLKPVPDYTHRIESLDLLPENIHEILEQQAIDDGGEPYE